MIESARPRASSRWGSWPRSAAPGRAGRGCGRRSPVTAGARASPSGWGSATWPPSPVVWSPVTAAGPCFLADAVADPLAGLVAAAAVMEALAAGGRWLLDVALAPLAAARRRPGPRRVGRAGEPAPGAPVVGPARGWDPTRPRCWAGCRVSSLVLRDAEVEGARVDVRVEGGIVTRSGPRRGRAGADEVVECGGAALVPGLHDHHLHLLSMAAVAASVDVSRRPGRAIRAAHARGRRGAAIRAVHYDEGRDGPLGPLAAR